MKNHPAEMLIDEFEDISRILSAKSYDKINMYRDVFIKLGADPEELKKVTFKQLGEYVKEWNKVQNIKKELERTIEINGYTYASYEEGEDFLLYATDMGYIERAVKKMKERNHWAEIIAILFKREDLTDAEHYEDAHIRHKAKLFRENGVTAEIVVPYIAIVTKELAEATKAALLSRSEEILDHERAEKLEGVNG